MARQMEAIYDKMPKPKFGLEPWVVDSKLNFCGFFTSQVT